MKAAREAATRVIDRPDPDAPNHLKQMGKAAFLLMWIRANEIDAGSNELAPISDREARRLLPVAPTTLKRWRKRLTRHGYITARQTPEGFDYKTQYFPSQFNSLLGMFIGQDFQRPHAG